MRVLQIYGSLALFIPSSFQSVAASGHESRAPDDAALKWGPYRPNLYFGVRPQIPDTLLMGMMWGQGQDKASLIDSTSRPLSLYLIRSDQISELCSHAGMAAAT